MIPGVEWSAGRIHLNFIGIKEYPFDIPWNPTDDDIKNAIKNAHELGALVQCNHISWTTQTGEYKKGMYTHPKRRELIEWGVDGFEVNCEVRWIDGKTIQLLEYMQDKGELKRPIFQAHGTDVHNPANEPVMGWTEILLNKVERENPTIEIIKKALKEGRTKVWMNHDWYNPPEQQNSSTANSKNPLYTKFYNFGWKIYSGGVKGTTKMIIKWILKYIPIFILYWIIYSIN